MISQPALLDRIMEPQRGDFSPELARYVLRLGFPPADQARCAKLSKKAKAGTLSPAEELDLDDYLSVNAFLMILQSKARVSLRDHGAAG